MPIEIRELVIKAVVSQGDASASSAASAPAAASEGPGGQDSLQESIEQIIQILDDKKER
jgi:hypothetical protein